MGILLGKKKRVNLKKSKLISQPEKEGEIIQDDSLIKTKDTNKVIVILFILTGSLLLSVLVNLAFVFLSLRLGTRDKIFVTRQGEVEIAEEKDPHFRSDELLKETVSNWIHLTHEWDSRVPGSNTPDSGVNLSGDRYFKVPSRVYAASYLLELGFRNQFLEGFSKSIPSNFYQGNVSSEVKIYHIGNITRVKDNLYTIRVIMSRTERDAVAETQEIKFDQIFHLQATQPHRLILGDEEPSAFRKQLNLLLKNGLIIYKISAFS